MLNKKSLFGLLLVLLAFSMLFANLVRATPGDGVDNYYDEIPTVSPSPTPSNGTESNSTNTNSTQKTVYVYVNGAGIQNINPDGVPLEFSSYNTTTALLLFAECLSCSLNVSSNSRWHETRDSSGVITFYPDEVDTYELHYQVIYDRIVNQTITLSIEGGDGLQQNLNLASVNSGFALDVILHVLVLPEYPSAMDIALAQDSLNRQLLYNVTRQNQAQDTTNHLIMGGTIAAVVILGILVCLLLRHQRHRDAQVNNLNANGFGGGKR